MRNFNAKGVSLPLTAPVGGVLSGVPLLIGALLVVPATDADEGETFTAYLEGDYTFDAEGAANGQAWTELEVIYWDDANKRFTTTALNNHKAGVASTAKVTLAVVGTVRLLPTI